MQEKVEGKCEGGSACSESGQALWRSVHSRATLGIRGRLVFDLRADLPFPDHLALQAFNIWVEARRSSESQTDSYGELLGARSGRRQRSKGVT